jgi:site-specific DNA recombinase
MRAAIYVRYSSDNQRDASIEDQIRLCRDRLERDDAELVQTYSDRAISGATMLRPGLQGLLEEAMAGKFDVVYAEALDRISRDQADVATVYKRLSFVGIQIVTVAEGEISELHVGLKGTMNALFLKDLAQKTRRGLEGRVRQGRSGGGLCYGYDVVCEVDAAGNPVAGGRRINAAEAAIVRRIFELYAAGQSPRAIARALNADHVPGPRGRAWSDTAIRGHHTRRTGILHNALYVGRLVWNKQRYIKDPASGKRVARVNPEADWIVQDVPDLRIIDDALWTQVQQRLGSIRKSLGVAKARATRFWERRRPKHLLTGLVTCGACGGRFASVGRDYLACSAARRQGTCSNRQSIRRSALESLILDGLRHRLMQPDLVETFVTEFHAEVNRIARNRDAEVAAHRKDLTQVTRKLDTLIEAIADGLRSDGLQAKLEALESRKKALERGLTDNSSLAPRLHPNLSALYRRKVARLHESLADPSIRDEALGNLRGLIESVVMHSQEDGFTIELVGEIANMVALALGPDTQKAASGEAAVPASFRRSVKVVAGAGFEPATFRL